MLEVYRQLKLVNNPAGRVFQIEGANGFRQVSRSRWLEKFVEYAEFLGPFTVELDRDENLVWSFAKPDFIYSRDCNCADCRAEVGSPNLCVSRI